MWSGAAQGRFRRGPVRLASLLSALVVFGRGLVVVDALEGLPCLVVCYGCTWAAAWVRRGIGAAACCNNGLGAPAPGAGQALLLRRAADGGLLLLVVNGGRRW